MDAALRHAIEIDELNARQLCVLTVAVRGLMRSYSLLFEPKRLRPKFCAHMVVVHANPRYVASLLSTQMRDANTSGSAWREVHRRVGWYLATELVSRMIGLEEYSIQHVQGHTTSGHRIRDEGKTCIVALMRGGEPFSLGVSDALLLAMFLDAQQPEDITP
jgi:hypothetical protein